MRKEYTKNRIAREGFLKNTIHPVRHSDIPKSLEMNVKRGSKTKMSNGVKNLLEKIITFLKEVRVELKKVNWPTRNETIKYTLIIIGVSLVVAIFLGGLDFIFTWLISKFVI